VVGCWPSRHPVGILLAVPVDRMPVRTMVAVLLAALLLLTPAGAGVLADVAEPGDSQRVAVRPTGVERVAGADRVATAVAASQRAFDRADVVVLAAAGSFADALAAAPLAARLGGPLLLVGPRATPVLLDELARLGAVEAVVVGAVGAVPLIVNDELTRAGVQVRRIAGESRFDTAALVAREVGSADGRAVVVNSGAFADALSIAPYAAAEGIPILLTPVDQEVGDTSEVLVELGITETLVIGGAAAVSERLLATLPSPTRIAGATRYATSVAVAEHWAADGMVLETIHVATGRDFPDALAAGPLAALARGPLLLVDGRDPSIPADTYAWLEARADDIEGAYVFGGGAVVTDAVVDRLRRAIGGDA
jgi:lactocepin